MQLKLHGAFGIEDRKVPIFSVVLTYRGLEARVTSEIRVLILLRNAGGKWLGLGGIRGGV